MSPYEMVVWERRCGLSSRFPKTISVSARGGLVPAFLYAVFRRRRMARVEVLPFFEMLARELVKPTDRSSH